MCTSKGEQGLGVWLYPRQFVQKPFICIFDQETIVESHLGADDEHITIAINSNDLKSLTSKLHVMFCSL